jgi:flavin-dependent dehydrogenase
MRAEETDVVIIGAGPSGAVAAALLRRHDHRVLVLERETFPRFSIGESLLPHSMTYLEEAGLLRDVVEAGFQHKNGASFSWNGRETSFDFRDKFTPGWGSTYQVQRARFDKVLADGAARTGAEIRYQHQVIAVDFSSSPALRVRDEHGETYEVRCQVALDASGFGRLLPRMLQLELPSDFPVRQAFFTHIEDAIPSGGGFDRNKIRVTVHPERADVWFWLIPFSNGRSSIGVVAEAAFLDAVPGDPAAKLERLANEDVSLRSLLARAIWDTPVNTMRGYASRVKHLCAPGYALLGNAGEFLDPVFSSGVTIALTSASLAARCTHKQLSGQPVDWDEEFARPLSRGVDVFRAFLTSWYAGRFQRVIFHPGQQADIRRMICSVLAGYAWDQTNPFVADPGRLGVLEDLCAEP